MSGAPASQPDTAPGVQFSDVGATAAAIAQGVRPVLPLPIVSESQFDVMVLSVALTVRTTQQKIRLPGMSNVEQTKTVRNVQIDRPGHFVFHPEVCISVPSRLNRP